MTIERRTTAPKNWREMYEALQDYFCGYWCPPDSDCRTETCYIRNLRKQAANLADHEQEEARR